jgi:outer membrane protein OmpA-like peptidoglycan-associated protein
MASSRTPGQRVSSPDGRRRRTRQREEGTAAAEAGPEGLNPEMEAVQQSIAAIEHNLQRASGGSVEFSSNPGERTRSLLALQHVVGNRSVRRMVQRQPHDAGTTPAGGTTDPDAALPQDLRDFRAAGPYPATAQGTTVVPRTGMGGFNARYDPRAMTLEITLNIGMRFVNGMNITGSQVTAADNSMTSSATQINRMLSRLHGQTRQDALAAVRTQWQWSGAGDPRIAAFMSTYRSSVTGAWSSAGTGLSFQGSRPGWEGQRAAVNVNVNIQDTTATAPGQVLPAGPRPLHCQANIFKTPDEDVFGANVDPGTAASGTDQFLSLGSGQVTAQSHLLTQSVRFANNSTHLSERAQARLRRWIISFQSPTGAAGNSIAITGRANTVGDQTEQGRAHNEQLALDRAHAVDDFLKNTSVESSTLRNADTRITGVSGEGATGASEGAEWRRVDIVVGSGQGQNIAAHEFGHMLGLADEYASTPKRDSSGQVVTDSAGDPVTRGLISGTGGDVGGATGHDQLARDMGLGGAVYENNDNIMSLGSTVRPQHYATFMQALREVSGINDWQIHR